MNHGAPRVDCFKISIGSLISLSVPLRNNNNYIDTKVTNHRMDSVNFTFKIEPTPAMAMFSNSTRRPNFHLPSGREVKRRLEPRQTVCVTEVDKLDLTREFQS